MTEKGNDSKATGITGLDSILGGGLPAGAQILVAGNPGAGKTILSAQFLSHGCQDGDKGIYVSFAETKQDFYNNMATLGMDFESFEKKGLFKYFDFATVTGEGIQASIDMMFREVTDFGADRLVIDSVSAIAQLSVTPEVRVLLHSVIGRISKSLGVTTILVTEVPFGESRIGLGVEEFVADGVILLKHGSIGTARKMQLELLKMRGKPISRSAFEYVITQKAGGLDLITIPHKYSVEPSEERVSIGLPILDRMFRGGLFRSSVTLIKGPSGVGKTALALHTVTSSNLKSKSRLFISFEEPIGQIVRLGEGIGLPIKKLMENGTLRMESFVPEALALPEYYKAIDGLVEETNCERLVVDGLASVRHIMPPNDFVEFSRYLQLLSKNKRISLFMTIETGTSEEAMSEMSIVADNLISLRFRETPGRPLGRELSIIKTRGSSHERRRVDFIITKKGIIVYA